jgi:hypothetical protein
MTFVKIRKRREVLRRTVKPTRIVFGLVAAVAAFVSVGYIMALAILAPEQLAEATTAATDLVCSGCVGTSDIADNAITSAKIGSGQVAVTDIATDAVTSTKIKNQQVATNDLATGAVTTHKISDTSGVYSVDIVNGQVATADILDGGVLTEDIADLTITSEDLADDAVQLDVNIVSGEQIQISPGSSGYSVASCGVTPAGGGYLFDEASGLEVYNNRPFLDFWEVAAHNFGNDVATLTPYAVCISLRAGGEQ